MGPPIKRKSGATQHMFFPGHYRPIWVVLTCAKGEPVDLLSHFATKNAARKFRPHPYKAYACVRVHCSEGSPSKRDIVVGNEQQRPTRTGIKTPRTSSKRRNRSVC